MFNFLLKLNKLRRAGKVDTITEAFNLARQEGLEISGILEQGIKNALKIKPSLKSTVDVIHPGVTPKKSIIPQKKINYTEMEDKLGVKLRGNETFDELIALEKELTTPKFTKAENEMWKYTQAKWLQQAEKEREPFYKMFGAKTKVQKDLIADFIETTGTNKKYLKKAGPKYLWTNLKVNISDELDSLGVDYDISMNLIYGKLGKSFESANNPKGFVKSINQRLKELGIKNKKINEKFYQKVIDDLYETTEVDPGDIPFASGGLAGMLGERTGYKDAKKVKGRDEEIVYPPYETNDPEEAIKEVIQRLIGTDPAKIPITDKLQIMFDLDRIKAGGSTDLFGGELDFGYNKGFGRDDESYGFEWKKSFAGGGLAPLLGEPTYADENHRVPYQTGEMVLPKAKPFTIDMFKDKADLYIQGIVGGMDKNLLNSKIKDILKKAVNEGSITSDEGIKFINDRVEFYKNFAEENPGGTMPRWEKNEGGRVPYGKGKLVDAGRRWFLEMLVARLQEQWLLNQDYLVC